MTAPQYGVIQHSEVRHAVLRDLVAKAFEAAQGEPLRILEIGSYEGASALNFAAAIAAHGTGSVLCIDPWRSYLVHDKSDGALRMNQELASGAVFKRFLHNITLAPEAAPIGFMRGTIETVSPFLKQNAFHLIYVDGDHSYEGCKRDLTYTLRLVAKGGIVCGDDIEREYPDARPEEFNDPREYNGSFHPGVTRAVWEFFGQQRVWVRNGCYAARRVLGGFSFDI